MLYSYPLSIQILHLVDIQRLAKTITHALNNVGEREVLQVCLSINSKDLDFLNANTPQNVLVLLNLKKDQYLSYVRIRRRKIEIHGSHCGMNLSTL